MVQSIVVVAALMALLGVEILLVSALRQTLERLYQTNTQLMILVGTRDGGGEVGRALVASQKEPKRVIPGIAEPLKEGPKPLVMTVGAM
jgi:hypothetical protein